MDNFADEVAFLESTADVPVMFVDRTATVARLNVAFEREWGWRASSSSGLPLHCMIPPRLRTGLEIAWSRYQSMGDTPVFGQVLRLPFLDAQGNERQAEVCIYPAGPVAEGAIAAMVCPVLP